MFSCVSNKVSDPVGKSYSWHEKIITGKAPVGSKSWNLLPILLWFTLWYHNTARLLYSPHITLCSTCMSSVIVHNILETRFHMKSEPLIVSLFCVSRVVKVKAYQWRCSFSAQSLMSRNQRMQKVFCFLCGASRSKSRTDAAYQRSKEEAATRRECDWALIRSSEMQKKKFCSHMWSQTLLVFYITFSTKNSGKKNPK